MLLSAQEDDLMKTVEIDWDIQSVSFRTNCISFVDKRSANLMLKQFIDLKVLL